MFAALRRVLRNLMRTVFPNRRKGVSPDEIIDRALEEAKLHAQDWGVESKKELPNSFDVTINGWDWSEYYSKRTEEIAKRMAITLLERIDTAKYVMEGTPVFGLYRSGDPEFDGVTVRAGFTGPENGRGGNPPHVRPKQARSPMKEAKCLSGGGLGDAQTIELCGGDTLDLKARNETVLRWDPPETATVERGAARAFLEHGSLRFPVCDGFRIGADREGSNAPAEILLPNAGHERTSREHGAFSLGASQWAYVNHGANGTRVEHCDGSVERLASDERCALSDGDVLYFGTSTGYRFNVSCNISG